MNARDKMMITSVFTLEFWEAKEVLMKYNWEVHINEHFVFFDGRKRSVSTFSIVHNGTILKKFDKTFTSYSVALDKAHVKVVIWLAENLKKNPEYHKKYVE